MTRHEEKTINEQKQERNIRFIRAKIVTASPAETAMIAGFIRGLGVVGWDDSEYNRPVDGFAAEVQNGSSN